MSALKDELRLLAADVVNARKLVDVEALRMRLSLLTREMNTEGFWDDSEKAQRVSREAAEMNQELGVWDSLWQKIRDLSDVVELAEEESESSVLEEAALTLQELQKTYRTLELKTLLSGEYDASNAILSIHAGAGGTDAQDFAEMLLRMYLRYAEAQGYKAEILDQSFGEEAGIKSTTFSISGRFAYGFLKTESGVHRLVRVSPFDAEGMRHTAFALVEVIPEFRDLDESALQINPIDLRIDTFASSGAGGQSVNTTNSAVRITHLPTNTVVSCQNERSQQQNRETAMKVLKSRLFQLMIKERKETLSELKGKHVSAEWGSQIRSYVLHPYKLVKDHRTGFESTDVDAVLNGEIVPFMEAMLKDSLSKK